MIRYFSGSSSEWLHDSFQNAREHGCRDRLAGVYVYAAKCLSQCKPFCKPSNPRQKCKWLIRNGRGGRIWTSDPLVPNHKIKKSKSFIWCR